MAVAPDSKEILSFEELLMSQVAPKESLLKLLLEKGIFTKEEFLEMMKVVNWEMKEQRKISGM
jgi:hypothetical protein